MTTATQPDTDFLYWKALPLSIHFLKRADQAAEQDRPNIEKAVRTILSDIKSRGEQAAIEYAKDFDHWQGDILVPPQRVAEAIDRIEQQVKDDIRFAHDRVLAFAQSQLCSLGGSDLTKDGITTGHRLVPVNTAGCYVPGGRYAHVASAVMSVTTAKAAGVKKIIACSPAKDDVGMNPAILYAMDLCGADHILAIGGVQAIAAMAYGCFTGLEADILVGPGNIYVSEAKRQLFGETGIDLFAGPTEIAIIADKDADAQLIATDLVSQMEHGPTSPAWLIATDETLARDVMRRIPDLITGLPEAAETATEAWESCAEVVVCDSREEAVEMSDRYAPEHLEVHAADLGWWHDNLTNYGSLFLGEECTVTYGDKVSGPNHILPTSRAARYTGGLGVAKFLKTLTYQKMTPQGSLGLAEPSARISRLEGMEGHARSADARLEKYKDCDRSQSLDVDLSQPDPIPEAGISRVCQLMHSGRLHRYGEAGGDELDVLELEKEFAAYLRLKYCVAVNSCGSSLFLALKCAGVSAGDEVLVNAFTLAPVPGAIAHCGADAILVDITQDYVIDTSDLRKKASSSKAKVLLLSHMRGHIADMDEIGSICEELGLMMVEDCAHTMGAGWNGRLTGTFGTVGCFSTQSFKHLNSGEGGLLVTSDENIAAKAILYSGSYMLYHQHGARPDDSVFDTWRGQIPNFSMRMSNHAAAMLRPQLPLLSDRAAQWNRLYSELESNLADTPGLVLPERPPKEEYIGSSIQFSLEGASTSHVTKFLEACERRGVFLKWFGNQVARGFTSTHKHWGYLTGPSDVPRTDVVLENLMDMRIPLAASTSDMAVIADVITSVVAEIRGSRSSETRR
jgi:sulfopropanediol 3-dehydrogenase